jgi:hypothetical protein
VVIEDFRVRWRPFMIGTNSHCTVSNIPMPDFNYPIWSIWTQMSLLYRAFGFLLSLVGAYMHSNH